MNNAKIDKAAGQAKEVLCQVTGNKKLENEGKLEQAGASIREVAGKAIDSVGNAAERLKEKLSGKG